MRTDGESAEEAGHIKSFAHRVNGISPRGRQALLLLCLLVVAALFAADLAAPRDVTLGAALIVPVLLAWATLETWSAIAVLVIAAATRVTGAIIGDEPALVANIEVISYLVGTAVVALTLRRAGDGVPVIAPEVTREPVTSGAVAPTFAGVGLTERERQVLAMTLHGLTAAQIGERLFIGRRTVESHLERAYGKLGVRSKREFLARTFDGMTLFS